MQTFNNRQHLQERLRGLAVGVNNLTKNHHVGAPHHWPLYVLTSREVGGEHTDTYEVTVPYRLTDSGEEGKAVFSFDWKALAWTINV
jgi:hypothetical protein